MVVIGGITRLTLSGLSITEWQPVTGIVPPLSAAAWAAEFEKYQQIPQYRLLNAGMSLGEFKSIFLWEYVHRLWGRLIGFVYALPLLYFLVRRRMPRRLVLPLAGIFLLGFAQGALGWYMVESGLADRVSVSQYRLVAHLALALAIYALTLWIALGILSGANANPLPHCGRGGTGRRSGRWVRAPASRPASAPSPRPSPPLGEREFLPVMAPRRRGDHRARGADDRGGRVCRRAACRADLQHVPADGRQLRAGRLCRAEAVRAELVRERSPPCSSIIACWR